MASDIETNEDFPARYRETKHADFDKLEEYKTKKAESGCAEATGPDQRAAEQMRPGFCTNQIHPGGPGVTFLGTDT